MDPQDWLRKALHELAELASNAQADASDARRTVTLVARLLGSPSGPAPPAAVVRRLPEILAVAGPTDPQELVDAVAEELESDTEPWGPLLDALLDADDAVSMLALSGEAEKAVELAKRVAGLASLYSERVLVLGSFAEMRLETVRSDSVVAGVWNAVARAPAQMLVEALPAVHTSAVSSTPPPTRLHPRSSGEAVSFLFPAEFHLAAADSATGSEVAELEAEEPNLRAWAYREEGRLRLEITGLTHLREAATLVAERLKDRVALARVPVEITVSGSTAYADLGPSSGPENLLHRLVADSGAAPEEVSVRLMLVDG